MRGPLIKAYGHVYPADAVLEEALRVFDGIALYDGTWELDEDTLEYFCRHYGMVSL